MVRLTRSRSPSHRPLVPGLITPLAVNYPSHRQLLWQMPNITGVSGLQMLTVFTVPGAPHVRSAIDTVAPPAPVLKLPADNATVIGTPTFSWLAAAGANAYQFEYDDDPGFGSPDYTSPVLTTLTHKPPTMPLGTYLLACPLARCGG